MFSSLFSVFLYFLYFSVIIANKEKETIHNQPGTMFPYLIRAKYIHIALAFST